MDRRAFIGCLAIPLSTVTQAARKVPRIGVLRWGTPDDGSQARLREALGAKGYREGRNIAIAWRWATRNEDAARHATQLVQSGVDVIVAAPTPAAHAARDATRTVPIVLAGVADPVRSGLVSSLARPGGNITGVSFNFPAVTGKLVQLLKETLPDVTQIAFLAATGDPAAQLFIDEIQSAAQRAGLRVQVVSIDRADEFEDAFSIMARERAQAVIIQPLFTPHARVLAELSQRHRLPLIAPFPSFVRADGLMSYGPSSAAITERTVVYVEKILDGAKPGDLPIEEPTRFEFLVNLKTAGAFGITIPRSVLLRADEVIQ